MKFTKESVLKTFNSLTMPAWIKRVFQLIVDYIDDAASSIDSKADLVGGKVPAEQLPSYVDDVINFWDITTGVSSISIIINNVNYTNRMWFITKSTSSGSIGAKYPNKFIDFGANTSEEDWTIIEPEEGKIYIKIGSGNDSNHSFRWSGINLIDLDKNWSDKINNLEAKTLTVYLSDIQNPLDLSTLPDTSILSMVYTYLNQRARYLLINLRWRYKSADYSSPIIDVDPIERSFRIYNQGYLQTYKVLKEDNNYSLVKVKEFLDFVYLDYSTLGAILDDETIEQIKKASMILVNDDANNPNNKSIYVVKSKTNTYLQFIKVDAIDGSDQKIVYKEISVNTSTKKWVINTKNYTLPYGAYTSFGFSGKSSSAVNQEVARLVNMNSYNITSSDLNKVHSGDKLENIKNATFLILDEGRGKTKIFARGYSSDTVIYYNCITNSASMNYILLRMPSNLLGPIENAQFDDIMFSNYKAKGGTKTNKDLMYKELIAQLTENTYVLDSSKLNTVLTDAEASSVQNATTLIISNSNTNNLLVFKKGYIGNEEIYFTNINLVSGGSLSISRIIYNTTTKTCSNIALSTVDPYVWYIGNGGNKSNKNDFININKFLYNNTCIINKTLLNTTIRDTSIQDSIKRANILVVEDSTDNSYVLYIKGTANTDSHFFYNINAMISTSIDIKRIEFKISTNLLSVGTVYFSSALKSYQLGGGTKYTTELTFNAQFAKVIDMTITQ